MNGKVLYGVKLAVATPIDKDTQAPKQSGKIIFKTAEEVSIEKVVSEGAEEVKRVDDEILAVVSTKDIGYGYNLTLVDNVFQLDFLGLLEGGTVRKDESQNVVGYDDPLMSSGGSTTNFMLELYVASYIGTNIDSYIKLTFPNCTGNASKLEFKKEFSAPEFNIKAREATKLNKPSRLIDIVKPTELPTEAATVLQDTPTLEAKAKSSK